MALRHGSWRSSRRAFTLIELLVVVAIITVLIALLVPALSRAKDYSKGTLCGSNLRGIASAAATYSAEYDQWIVAGATYPSPLFSGGPKTAQFWWTSWWSDSTAQSIESQAHGLLSLGSLKIVQCPSIDKFGGLDVSSAEIITDFGTYAPGGRVTPCSYALNGGDYNTVYNPYSLANLGNNYISTGSLSGSGLLYKTMPRTTTGVTDPQNTVYFYDSAQENPNYPSTSKTLFCGPGYIKYAHEISASSFNLQTRGYFSAQHLGMGTVAFMDGHVELRKPYQPQDLTANDSKTGLTYGNLYKTFNMGYLTDDDLTEPWLTYVASVNTLPGKGYLLFAKNKNSSDQ